MHGEATSSAQARRGRRLLLLRHGEVVSHRGDQPLTTTGRGQAEEAGRGLAARGLGSVRLLSGATRRACETADGVLAGLSAEDPTSRPAPPQVAFALRNPDLYLAGDRVDMVSTAEAFAAQVPAMTAEAVLEVPFYAGFLGAADRIGFWLRSSAPPGDDAARVAARIADFAVSLGDAGPSAPDTVVAVTHSPVLRAVALAVVGEDPGEPAYLTGYSVELSDAGVIGAVAFDPLA
jgi:broad specificity phosphatase PhoE